MVSIDYMKAKIKKIAHIICPHCGEGENRIDHLDEGQTFGPWYCDECGKAYRGKRTKNGAEIEKLLDQHREVAAILQYRFDKRLFLVVPALQISNRQGVMSPIAEELENHAYYFNYHTCPSNFLRSGEHVTPEVIFDGDGDPHGIFEFVAIREDK